MPFAYERAQRRRRAARSASQPGAAFLAGGTNLVDLMKGGVAQPTLLVDITRLPLAAVDGTRRRRRAHRRAACATATSANHPLVRARYPLLSQALLVGRVAAAAQHGDGRRQPDAAHALLLLLRHRLRRLQQARAGQRLRGAARATTASTRSSARAQHCIATHPSDMCVALAALDADRASCAARTASARFRSPSSTACRATRRSARRRSSRGELIVAVDLPPPRFAARSHYLKVRDRASYAFALVSVAAALDVRDGSVRDARDRARRRRAQAVARRRGRAGAGRPAARRRVDRRGRTRCCSPARSRCRDNALQGRAGAARDRAGAAHRAEAWRDRHRRSRIDRVDGTLKVTGRARYAAEFAGAEPGARRARARARSRAAASSRIDVDARASAPGVLAVLTHDERAAPAARRQGGGQSAGRARAVAAAGRRRRLQQPAGRGGRRRHARARGAGGARWCASPTTPADGEARLRQSRKASAYPPAKAQPRRRPTRARRRRRPAWPRPASQVDAGLHDADRAPQPDGAARDDRRLGRRPADAVRRDAGRRRRAQTTLAKMFGIPPENVRVHRSLRRRRLRLQGLGVVARRRWPRWRRQGDRPAGASSCSSGRRCSARSATGRRPSRRSRSAPTATASSRRSATPRSPRPRRSTSGSRPRRCRRACSTRARTTRRTHRLVRLNIGTPTFMRAPGEASGNVRARVGDGRAGRRAAHGSARAAPAQLRRAGPGQGTAVVEQVAARVLRARRRALRLAPPRRRAGLDARRPLAPSASAWRPRPTRPTAARPTRCVRLLPDGSAIVALGDAGPRHRHLHGDDAGRRRRARHSRRRGALRARRHALPKAPGRRRLADGGERLAGGAGGLPGDARESSSSWRSPTRGRPPTAATPTRSRWPTAGFAAAPAHRRAAGRSPPSGGEPIAALLRATAARRWRRPASAKPGAERKQYSMHSFGAVFAEVRVDAELGIVRVPRIVGRVRRRQPPQREDGAQPAARRHRLGHRHGAARGDGARPARRPHRQRATSPSTTCR